MPQQPATRNPTALFTALLLTAAAALPGCFGGSGLAEDSRRGGKRIGPEAFVGEVIEAGAAGSPPIAIATPDPDAPDASQLEIVPNDGSVAGDLTAAVVGDPELVDSKVGELNGLPIFATAFLKPLSGRLEAEARRQSRREWIASASELIVDELNDLLLDELLRAEALERLTPEQRQGLFGFLETTRRNLASQNYGSQRLAQERLAEQSGITEEEFLEQQRQTALVQTALREQVAKRVTVSWRDIRLRYERDSDLYRPPPTAVFRIIAVDDENQDGITEVTRRLAAGEPFAEVAAGEFNRFAPEDDHLRAVAITGSLVETEIFAAAVLNDAAVSLSPGQTSEPVKVAGRVYWVRLEAIETQVTPLYDAQRSIEAAIRAERLQEELDRFLQRLVERSNITTLDGIRRRLLVVAIDRYAPES